MDLLVIVSCLQDNDFMDYYNIKWDNGETFHDI